MTVGARDDNVLIEVTDGALLFEIPSCTESCITRRLSSLKFMTAQWAFNIDFCGSERVSNFRKKKRRKEDKTKNENIDMDGFFQGKPSSPDVISFFQNAS